MTRQIVSCYNLKMNRGKIKNILLNSLLVSFSLLFSLLLVEGVLRLYGVMPETDRLYFYKFDEMLGWTTKQSFRYFRSTRHYAHFNYYDNQGYPTTKDEWEDEFDKDKPSIVLLGDSFAEGYYLPYENTFAYLLEKRFQDKYQVVNLGVSGYAPDQYLIRARQEMEDLNVQKIIVAFFPFNDIEDIFRGAYQGYAKPLFEKDLERPVNTPLERLDQGEEKKSLVQKLFHNSAIYSIARPLVRNYFALNIVREEGNYVYNREKMERALELIKQIKIEFEPGQFAVYYMPRLEELQKGAIQENTINFATICKDLEVECYSFYSIAKKHSQVDELYIPEDGHFSEKGSLWVASHLYGILED